MSENLLNGKSILKNKGVCRVCMKISESPQSLQSKIVIDNKNIDISQLLMLCASVQISDSDGMPQVICDNCEDDAKKSYVFRILCETSDKIFRSSRELLQSKPIEIQSNENPDEDNVSCGSDISSCDQISSIQEAGYECTKCMAKFEKKKDYNVHVKLHKTYICKDCGGVYNTKRELRRHTYKHSYTHIAEKYPVEKRTCPQCGKIFQYRSSLLKHIKKHSAPPQSCPYCDFVPQTPRKLTPHMEERHAHLKSFICGTCGKTFFKETNLRLHQIVHSGVKKHTCEICGMSFALAGNLAAHRRLHTGEKPYTCSDCGRGFTQQSALRSHEAGHSNRKDHVCSECGAAFSRAGALRNHRKRHSKDKPFVCPMCGQAFTFSSELKRHITIHTGVKNYVCEVCNRRFNRSTNLKVHKRIHTGETPHACNICGKGFIQAHCLRTHMNTHVLPTISK